MVEGSLGRDVEFDDNNGTAFTVKGIYERVGTEIDPDTGQRVVGSTSHVLVRLSSLQAVPKDGWKVTTTDITGNQVVGYVQGVMQERTRGLVELTLRGVT